jgi:hypothetical protein
MGTGSANLVSWCLGGSTTLCDYDHDSVYMLVRADTDDPELQREVALVGAWDMEGERYARMIAAVPKLLAACQAAAERWEQGDLAEAARMCSAAVDAAIRGEPFQSRTNQEVLEMEKHQTRIIRLPCFGIEIRLVRQDSPENSGEGTIASDLRDTGDAIEVRQYNAAIDALESLILAHACAGVDVESPAYIEGIETAVEAIGNHV